MCLFISLLNIIQNIHESDYGFHVKFTRFTNKTKAYKLSIRNTIFHIHSFNYLNIKMQIILSNPF